MPCNVVYCNVLYIVPSLKRKWLKIHSFMICSRMLWLQVQCLITEIRVFFPLGPSRPSPLPFLRKTRAYLMKIRRAVQAYYEPRRWCSTCWITDDFAWIIPTEGEIPTAQNPPRLFFLWSICQFSGHLLQNITMEAICQIRWFTLW